ELDVEEVIDHILDVVEAAYPGSVDGDAGEGAPEFVQATADGAHEDPEAGIDRAIADHETVIADAIARAEAGELGEDDEDWEDLEEAFSVLGSAAEEDEALPTVAIVGRPNVGKST